MSGSSAGAYPPEAAFGPPPPAPLGGYPAPPPPAGGYPGPASPQPHYGYGYPADGYPAPGPVQESYGYGAPYRPPPRPYTEVKLEPGELDQCRNAVQRVLHVEMDSLSTRLLAANERLHDQYDRISSEAALRLNIALPMAVFVVIAAVQANLGLLALLAAPAGLVLQGRARARAANEVLIQAVVTGVIQSTEIVEVTRFILEDRPGDT